MMHTCMAVVVTLGSIFFAVRRQFFLLSYFLGTNSWIHVDLTERGGKNDSHDETSSVSIWTLGKVSLFNLFKHNTLQYLVILITKARQKSNKIHNKL